MSELEELRTWLNSDKRDFDVGLQLYIAYFNDVDMRQYLTALRPVDKLYELIRGRAIELKEAISGQISIVPEKIVPATTAIVDSKKDTKLTEIKSTRKDAIIAGLEVEWKHLRAEQDIWKTQMVDTGVDNNGKPREHLTAAEQRKRGQLAAQLVQHDKKVFEIWNLIDYVNIHGHLPAMEKTQAPVIVNEPDFKRLKNSINPGISKLKKKIADRKMLMQEQKGKEWEKSNKVLTGWETQLKDLEAEKLKITQHGQEQSAA